MSGECQACRKWRQLDGAHIRSKGAGGEMGTDNMLLLCRACHTKSHVIGWVRFVARYPRVGEALREKGWELETLFGKTKLRRV